MRSMEPLPTSLAGLQNVETGTATAGDVLVFRGAFARLHPSQVGQPITGGKLYGEGPGVYRRIPVAKPGACDGFPDPVAGKAANRH